MYSFRCMCLYHTVSFVSHCEKCFSLCVRFQWPRSLKRGEHRRVFCCGSSMASPSALSQAGGLISYPPIQIDMSVLAVGIEKMCELSVADRVNFKIFQIVLQGTSVRVGGTFKHVSSGEQRLFTTSDGGDIVITSHDEELSSNLAGFVEVVGTKVGDQELSLSGIVPFGGDADVELWDEAVKMSHLPHLRHTFAPAV